MTHSGQRGACRSCCVECTIASDNFNRADSSTVDGWTEVSDDWAIVSNQLDPPTTGVIQFDAVDPGGGDGIRWSTTFNFGGSTGQKRWHVDMDGSQFHFLEIQCLGENSATMSLWKYDGAIPEQLAGPDAIANFNWSTNYTVDVCWGFQNIAPTCSSGTIVWYWTLDLDGPGLHGWQPREMYGECQDPNCGVVFPAVTGMEVEGDTTTTNCDTIFGEEGQPVFRLTGRISSIPPMSITSPAEPFGGDGVGLSTIGVGSAARFDNATLSRLQTNCPDCAAARPCQFCQTLTLPSAWIVEISGVTSDGECPTCNTFNRTYVIAGYPGGTDQTACGEYAEISESCGAQRTRVATDDVCVSSGSSGFQVSLFIGVSAPDGTPFDLANPIEVKIYIKNLADGGVSGDPIIAIFKYLSDYPGDGSEGFPDCAVEFDDIVVPLYCQRDISGCDFSGATVRVFAA